MLYLELIHFPAGKGDQKWQKQTESLFLGIDHTAIVVTNTAISLAFYSDLLEMKLQQQSNNSGSEQEHLSGIPDAKVQISSLKASAGLGIERLEYIEPDTGRPMPIDTRLNDLWCFQTIITFKDSISESDLAYSQGYPIQDPDGHIINPIFTNC
jgi:Glyoxalase/Bleomycin resistance protein/Dioxygenase superfamily